MGRGEPPRDLPAPYEDPWGLLRRDLVAVAASLRLRIWELARRNRQGELPRPGFWPEGLAAWFWPLLLALPLLLLLLALWLVPAAPEQLAGPAEEVPVAAAVSQPEPEPAALPGLEPTPQPEPVQAESPSVPPLPPALADRDPEGLIRQLRSEPGAALLELELDPRFLERAEPERQRLAEAWLSAAETLGYEQLRLRDGQGRLLGRRARVGSGMILFSAPLHP